MATDKTVNELVINKLTQAQYDAIPEAERSDTELYFITDADENALPDQTDNAGKFLMTDGENASWGEALVNSASVSGSSKGLSINKNNEITITHNSSIGIGTSTKATGYNNVAIGNHITTYGAQAIAIGSESYVGFTADAIAIGWQANVSAKNAVLISTAGSKISVNSDFASCFVWANDKDAYTLFDANGNVPLERLTYITDQIGDISTALTAILGE